MIFPNGEFLRSLLIPRRVFTIEAFFLYNTSWERSVEDAKARAARDT